LHEIPSKSFINHQITLIVLTGLYGMSYFYHWTFIGDCQMKDIFQTFILPELQMDFLSCSFIFNSFLVRFIIFCKFLFYFQHKDQKLYPVPGMFNHQLNHWTFDNTNWQVYKKYWTRRYLLIILFHLSMIIFIVKECNWPLFNLIWRIQKTFLKILWFPPVPLYELKI
jgi:hypothetical protein